jgi:hypothetical protein
MQLWTRPRNVTADGTTVEKKGSKDTPGKEPWGLRWRSSLGFVTFGTCLLPALSQNRMLNLNIC